MHKLFANIPKSVDDCVHAREKREEDGSEGRDKAGGEEMTGLATPTT